ncbi:MAG: CRISPR-associated helicase Cas3' [Bacillota bacterium]|nr:CRISPR-associated helicase Cas3' [Bacillota bacterium]
MELDSIDDALKDIWAKSSDSPGLPGLSLLQHTEEVVRQMGQFILLYQTELGQLSQVDMSRILLYGALLHDFGKIHPGFQKMLHRKGKFGHRHEVLSVGFLDFLEVPAEEKPYLVTAVALHHKDWMEITKPSIGKPCYFHPRYPAERIKPIQELLEGLELLHINGLLLLLQNANVYFQQVAGIKITPYPFVKGSLTAGSIYRQLAELNKLAGSLTTGNIPHRKVNRLLCHMATVARGLAVSADHLASSEGMSLQHGFASPEEVLAALGFQYETLHPHQARLANTPASLIMVSPTGSGKTEAALLWAGAVRKAKNTKGRLYFILPYRASMNAMKLRLEKHFGETSTAVIHGKTLIQHYQEHMEQGYTPDEARQRAKHKESLARLNTTPIRVCSPYQLVKTFFAPKGYEALLSSVWGAQLVMDEIHAYEHELTAMTLSAAKFMKEVMGAECLFMSATMPSYLKELLQRHFSLKEPLYPPVEWLKAKIRHRLELIPDHSMASESIQRIKKEAERGSVLVVVNKVNKAINLAKELEKEGMADVVLLHGRFSARDRINKEANLGPRKDRILVATQVVEVSLDIDYDTIFTEMAPLESLLQRFGRVNRKGQRSQHSVVHVFTEFEKSDQVAYKPYEKEHLLKVREVLHNFLICNPSGLISETQIQTLLDQSYPEDIKQELLRSIEDKINSFYHNFVQGLLPLGVQDSTTIRELREQWDNLFDGEELLPEQYLSDALNAPNTLEAAQYLIPVSGVLVKQLAKQNRVWFDEALQKFVTNCEYSPTYGLVISE